MSSFAEFHTSIDEFERGIINSKELAARKVEMGTTMVNRMRGCLGKAVFKEEVYCIVHERLCPVSPRCDHNTKFSLLERECRSHLRGFLPDEQQAQRLAA